MFFVLAFSVVLILAKPVISAPPANQPQELPAGITIPAPSVSTNDSGVPVYRFTATPVITNVAVVSNELVRMKARADEIDQEMKKLGAKGTSMMAQLGESHMVMNSYATNYIPKDEEGLALKEQIKVREGELDGLKAKLAAKMQADADYKQAQKEATQRQQAWSEFSKTKESLSKERRVVASEILQIRSLMEREERERRDKEGIAKGENGSDDKP